MCWSPKVKTPAVTAQIQAPTPAIMDTAKGVQFGDEDTTSKKDSKETSGIGSLTVKPNTEGSNSQATSTTMGSTSTGANFGSSAIKKKLAKATPSATKGGA